MNDNSFALIMALSLLVLNTGVFTIVIKKLWNKPNS